MADFPHGAPCWVELTSADADGAAEFYGELFGWEAVLGDNPEETGGYRMLRQGGSDVAGLMGPPAPGQPSAWLVYFSVEDADRVTALATEHGGGAVMGPMDVTTNGRMSVIADPAGAVFGIWQPRDFTGFAIKDEPNSFCWADVLTRDAEAALEFYPKVFGWSPGHPTFTDQYTVWNLPPEAVGGTDVHAGGMMQMTDEYFPAQVPSHWAVNFAVADTDAIVSRVPQLGGSVTSPAMDCPIGRFASFTDPQGASFSVMQFAQRSGA